MQRCTVSRGVLFLFGCLFAASGCTSSSDEPPTEAGTDVTESSATATAAAADAGVSPQDVAAKQRQIDERKRVVSAEMVKQGRTFLEQGRFDDARKAFLDAYVLDVTNREAGEELDRVNTILGKDLVGAVPEARDQMGGIQARHAQAQTLAKYHFTLGAKARAEGSHDAAVENFSKALTILKVNPSVDADFNEAQVRAALDLAKADRETAARETDRKRLEAVSAVERKRDEDERARIQRAVDETYRQAIELFKREKFVECGRACDEIIRLDFADARARELKEAARKAEIDSARAESIARHREEWQIFIEKVTEIRVPRAATVGYPELDQWKTISARGPIDLSSEAARPSEVDAEITRKLQSTPLTDINWNGKSLKDAITFLRNNTGLNFNIDRAVDEKVPEADRILTLEFANITAASALKLAVEELKLKYVVEGGMVRITTAEELAKRKVINLYEVRDLVGKIPNFISTEINLNVSGSAPGGAPPEEDTEDNKPIESDKLIEMIKDTIDKASWEDGTNQAVDKNGTLVVKQTAENHRLIRELLKDIRKGTGIQVAIESRFISVENNFLQDIGVDFRGLGDNSGGQGAPGRGTSAPFDDFGVPGTGPLSIGNDNSAGLYYARGADGDIRGRAENLFNSALGAPDTLTGSGGFAMQFAYIDDTQIEAILRAVQKYQRVNTVTAPKLVVSNTQRAFLQVINHVSYIKDFDVEIAQGAVIADPIVDVVKEGVILDVRPTVSNDRRFVTLELRPTVATLIRPLRTFTTTLGIGSSVTFEVPELKKESIKTTVVMPDGATMLLGGLKFYEEQDYVSGIPILKDIPILDLLFSRKGKYTSLKDLIVLLKVKVLIANELEPGSPSNI